MLFRKTAIRAHRQVRPYGMMLDALKRRALNLSKRGLRRLLAGV